MKKSPKSFPVLRRLMPFRIVAIVAKRTADLVGGDELKILSFAASTGIIHPGGSATICYGVNEAKTVRIEPPVENVYPALTHCLEVSPPYDSGSAVT